MTIDERVTQAVEGLRALKIVDEVRSDNPLARDAADLITDLQAALKEAERERDEARVLSTSNWGERERADAAQTRVRELEEALRKCADAKMPGAARVIARSALKENDDG